MSYVWLNINLPGTKILQWADTDKNDLVVIDSNGSLFATTKISSDSIFNLSPTWTQIPVGIKLVSVSNNKLAFIDYNDNVYQSSEMSTSPSAINYNPITSTSGKMKTISYDEISGISCGVRSDMANNYLSCNVFSNNIFLSSSHIELSNPTLSKI